MAPVRMCVGCRRRSPQSDLLRITVSGSELIPDLGVRHPGRGAYLHLDPVCLSKARDRRAFTRALRITGVMSDSAVAAIFATPKVMTVAESGD